MTKTAERPVTLRAANDVGPRTTTTASREDVVRIRQELAAAAFAQTPRGKRLLAARR